MLSKKRTMRSRYGSRRVFAGLAVVTTGMTFIGIPSCEGLLTTVNPCGSVFAFCTAEELDAFFGSIPDFSLDPTCTIPYFGLDPANQGVAGGCATVNVFNTTPGPRPQGEL
jgi:hypothetical protein